jgi:hypothetical protein
MSSATINTMFGWAIADEVIADEAIADEAIADEAIIHSSATSQ